MRRAALVVMMLLAATLAIAHPSMIVERVVPGGPAAAAGVLAGDRILRVAGREVAGMDDLEDILGQHRPGDTVTLAVQRQEETVELPLALGQRPDGVPMIGVELRVAAEPGAAGDELPPGAARCLAWIEETYGVGALVRELGLDRMADYEEIRDCVVGQAQLLTEDKAVRYCDNLFKVHCSAIDLMTDLAEAQVSRCEDLLRETLWVDAREHRGWTTCGQHRVFDRYAVSGASSDETACRAALLDECGTNLDVALEQGSLSPEQQEFVSCCRAETLDRRSPKAPERCAMLDEGLERGPCHDVPVCVNRMTAEWIRCAGSE